MEFYQDQNSFSLGVSLLETEELPLIDLDIWYSGETSIFKEKYVKSKQEPLINLRCIINTNGSVVFREIIRYFPELSSVFTDLTTITIEYHGTAKIYIMVQQKYIEKAT